MGVTPKGHQPGKWLLITDLSFPPDASVNDEIDPTACSMQYTSVKKVARAAQSLGRGALLAKLDIQAAYRLVPVHPQDRSLLGVRWHDSLYLDGCLMFGLRSSPIIFTALADALEWGFRQRGVTEVDHYLDDFITIGPPGSDICHRNLTIILEVCRTLGVPLAQEKLEGPSACLTFARHRDRHLSRCLAPPTRQANHDTSHPQEVARTTEVPQTGARIPNWPTTTRLPGCIPGALLPPADD